MGALGRLVGAGPTEARGGGGVGGKGAAFEATGGGGTDFNLGGGGTDLLPAEAAPGDGGRGAIEGGLGVAEGALGGRGGFFETAAGTGAAGLLAFLSEARGGVGGRLAGAPEGFSALGLFRFLEVEVFLGALGLSAMDSSYQSFSPQRASLVLRQVTCLKDD